MKLLFIKANGEVHGPYSPSQIKSMWDSGRITADAELGESKDGEWKSALLHFESLNMMPTSPPPLVYHSKAPEKTPSSLIQSRVKRKSPIGLLILLGLTIALAVWFFNFTTGPWTQTGKAESDIRDHLQEALWRLEESYDNLSAALRVAVSPYETEGRDMRMSDLNQQFRTTESKFLKKAYSDANAALAAINNADISLTTLRKKRAVSNESIQVYDTLKDCIVVQHGFVLSLSNAACTSEELDAWAAAKKRYDQQRIDLKIKAEFQL